MPDRTDDVAGVPCLPGSRVPEWRRLLHSGSAGQETREARGTS